MNKQPKDLDKVVAQDLSSKAASRAASNDSCSRSLTLTMDSRGSPETPIRPCVLQFGLVIEAIQNPSAFAPAIA